MSIDCYQRPLRHLLAVYPSSVSQLAPSWFLSLKHPSSSPSDRVVDDLNPALTFTRREVESLLHFVEEEPDPSQVKLQPQDGMEGVLRKALHQHPHLITKVGAGWLAHSFSVNTQTN